jgi:VanZ family protein
LIRRIIYLIPKVIRWLIFFIYLCTIVYASLASPSSIPKLFNIPHLDKIVHFIMYFGFCLLAIWCLDEETYDRTAKSFSSIIYWKYPLSLIMGISWGLMMELFQRIMNIGRHYSVFDLLANIIGAISGTLLYYYLIQRKLRK